MKIAIIGYSGSGKSTLAAKLGNIYNCPVLYLDRVHFKENWVERDDETAKLIVKEFMDNNDSWVIDGNYTNLLREQRLIEADMIIFMCFSRMTCLIQAINRYKTYKGKPVKAWLIIALKKWILSSLNGFYLVEDQKKRKSNMLKPSINIVKKLRY